MKILSRRIFLVSVSLVGLMYVIVYTYGQYSNGKNISIHTIRRRFNLVSKRKNERAHIHTNQRQGSKLESSNVHSNDTKPRVFDYIKNVLKTHGRLKPLKKDPSFYRINTTLSDKINVRRQIPDGRPDACKEKALTYPKKLPRASIVIIFRDEWPSVLIRTIYSLLANTPATLLQEVVLVNDGSEDVDIVGGIKRHFIRDSRIKLISNPRPLGLMRARQIGIESTLSEYFVVMDSHIEFSEGWLEPLLARLVEYPNNLLTSHIGTINSETFEVKFAKDPNNMLIAYDPLNFSELWAEYSLKYKRARNGSVDPIPVLAVQGMSIAMKKETFTGLGGFDPGMRQWGAEQFELSIKTWMCGGWVEKVPCSKVAHLYRVSAYPTHSLTVQYKWVTKDHSDKTNSFFKLDLFSGHYNRAHLRNGYSYSLWNNHFHSCEPFLDCVVKPDASV